MKFKEIKDKAKYLKKNYPFHNAPKLTDKKYCIHCNRNIFVADYKVVVVYNYREKKEVELIVCPNAPECEGTAIDWIVN